MKLLIFLFLDAGNKWSFINLLEAVFYYIIIHTVARYLERNWRIWATKVDPIYWQPFHHHLNHNGALNDCQEGMCKLIG